MFRITLPCTYRPDHPLAKQIPWKLYCSDSGRPCLPIRMLVGLLLLKHACGLSDEEVEWCLDSSHAQNFCWETHFRQDSQLDSNSLSRFLIRVGDSGELVLKAPVIALGRYGCIEEKRLEACYMVDTNGAGEGVMYPTDVMKWLNRVREHLVKQARSTGLKLRQSYVRVGPRRLLKVNLYARVLEVECISKGKTRKHCEFGVKVGGCGDQLKQLSCDWSGISRQSVRWPYAVNPVQLG